MIQCWKILHNKSPIQPEDLFTMRQRQTRGYEFTVFKERCNTDIRMRFFSNRITDEWNSLPSDVVCAQSIDAFKAKLHDHLKDRLYHHCDSL